MQNTNHHATKAITMKKLKAKIVRLHSLQFQGLLLDMWEQYRILGLALDVRLRTSRMKVVLYSAPSE